MISTTKVPVAGVSAVEQFRQAISAAGLHPPDDDGGGEDIRQGCGHLEVGLGVLETDGVDLVRHRRRADGPLPADLGEVAHRDVGPHILRQPVQDPIEARDIGIELGLPIVALDLGGQRVPLQPKAFHEGA